MSNISDTHVTLAFTALWSISKVLLFYQATTFRLRLPMPLDTGRKETSRRPQDRRSSLGAPSESAKETNLLEVEILRLMRAANVRTMEASECVYHGHELIESMQTDHEVPLSPTQLTDMPADGDVSPSYPASNVGTIGERFSKFSFKGASPATPGDALAPLTPVTSNDGSIPPGASFPSEFPGFPAEPAYDSRRPSSSVPTDQHKDDGGGATASPTAHAAPYENVSARQEKGVEVYRTDTAGEKVKLVSILLKPERFIPDNGEIM